MEYRIVKKEAFRIVGVRTLNHADMEERLKCIPAFWQEVHKSGVIPKIAGLMNTEPMGILAVSTYNGENEDNYYYIAVSTNKPAPDNMYEFTVPECTWAVFPGSGKPESIGDLQKRIAAEWLPVSGYEWAQAPDVEVYLNDDPVNMKYEVWLPVMKK